MFRKLIMLVKILFARTNRLSRRLNKALRSIRHLSARLRRLEEEVENLPGTEPGPGPVPILGEIMQRLSNLETTVAEQQREITQLQTTVSTLQNAVTQLQERLGRVVAPIEEMRGDLLDRVHTTVTIQTSAGPVTGTLRVVGEDYVQLEEPIGHLVMIPLTSIIGFS